MRRFLPTRLRQTRLGQTRSVAASWAALAAAMLLFNDYGAMMGSTTTWVLKWPDGHCTVTGHRPASGFQEMGSYHSGADANAALKDFNRRGLCR